MKQQYDKTSLKGWRRILFEVIFEADTFAGKVFDIVLMVSIVVSVSVVMLYSVQDIRQTYGALLVTFEWAFTILFSIEYLLRIICLNRPLHYIFSFFGFVDLLSILPTYLRAISPASRSLAAVRILRLLRIFRVLKLGRWLGEANMLMDALISSRRKILVFMFTVLILVIIIGSFIYVIEGSENGFTSIPRSVYWAVVTLTTVGYGDISPQTSLGQMLASAVMIMGYAIIAVPTGIISVEYSRQGKKQVTSQVCPSCTQEGHDPDAAHCKFCGAKLNTA